MDKATNRRVIKFVLNNCIYFLLFSICIIMSIVSKKFLTWSNLTNILLQTCIIGTLAIGVTYVLIAGGNDMSMGAVMGVSCCFGVNLFYNLGLPVWLGILGIFAMSMLFGLLNGFVVAYIRVPAFLATLSSKFIARGMTLVISQGSSMHGLPTAFTIFASYKFGGIPLMVFVMLILYVIFHIRLKSSLFGRRVYAVGGNREAARVSGINCEKTVLFAYLQCGFLVGIAAFLQAARMNSFWASMGTDLEFLAIAGAIMGGTSMSGGSGSLIGTFAGVILMGLINNSLNLLGVDANWQEAVRGTVILFTVIVDALRNRYSDIE